MAEPVDFEGANAVLQAPPSMSQDECLDLPIFRDHVQVISAWRLTEEEIAMIAETGVVWMSALGPTHPPIKISGIALVEIDGRPAKAEPVMPRAKR